MAVPKRRMSKSKKRSRRATHKGRIPSFSVDKSTGGIHLPHRVDPKTGMYNGRQVLSITADE